MEEKDFCEVCSFEVFQGLSDDSYRIIKEKGRIEELSANQIVIVEKNSVNHLYFVIDGIVAIYKINFNGQKKSFIC